MFENYAHFEPKTLAEELPLQVRHRATVVIPLLNHRPFVEDLLRSLIRQWRDDLALLIIDDGSQDGGFDVVWRCLADQPSIHATLLRNSQAMGIGVVQTVLRHVSTPIIIQADSDDIALPGRLSRILQCFDEDPACRLVTSNAIVISAEGIPIGLSDTRYGDTALDDASAYAASRYDARWLGATAAYHREVFDAFEPLDPATFPPTIDLIMPFRAALLGTHRYISTPLVGWRQHGSNTHRALGALRQDATQFEAMDAVDLAVHLQRLRDVRYLGQSRSADPAHKSIPDDQTGQCTQTLLDVVEGWVRTRSALGWFGTARAEAKPQPFLSAVPPISTVGPGTRIRFDQGGAGAVLAANWPGFHAAEAWGVWTHRHAMLSFRALKAGTTRLTLSLQKAPYLESQRFAVMIGDGAWQEFTLVDAITQIDLPLDDDVSVSRLTILLSVTDVVNPVEIDPDNLDNRVIGVGLRWLEAS